MERLTIGQMAKLNRVSEQTLRFYDKMHLLEPEVVSEENGYRYYSIKQSAILDTIQYMKSLGMKLTDIQKLMDHREPARIESILHEKSLQIDGEIHTLKCQKRAIERTLQSYRRYESSPPDGAIVLEFIEERRMYCIDAGMNFYDRGIEAYEEMLRKLKESLIADRLPQIYFCNAGTILRQKNLEQRRFDSSDIFVFVDREFVPDRLTVSVPANPYICMYCNEFKKEKEYAGDLLDAVREKGYRIVGDYICEVIAEFPLLPQKERGMFLRLQIPIQFG